MRCNRLHCQKRFTLRRHPSEYRRAIRCPGCGTDAVRSVEGERRRWIAKASCRCIGYPFPHRRGSLRMCIFHPLSSVEPTEAETEEYRQILEGVGRGDWQWGTEIVPF